MSPAIVHLRLHPDSCLRPLRSHFNIEKNQHCCNLPFPFLLSALQLSSISITIHHDHHNYSSLFLYFHLLLLGATTVAIIGRVDFVLVPPFPHQAALWTEPGKQETFTFTIHYSQLFSLLKLHLSRGTNNLRSWHFCPPKSLWVCILFDFRSSY